MNDGGHGETETLQMPEEITKGEAEIRAWLTSRGVRIPENRIELITTLYADGATIPAEIGNLVNLETLYADGATIPAEIGNLVNLKTLYASDATIPAEIGNLVNLKTLYASDAYANSPEAIAALIKRIRDGK